MSIARQRVLQAAIKCFAENGYAGTTITDIERAAGLSVGAGGTYRHFPSKKAMLEAIVEMALEIPDEQVAPSGDDLEGIAHEMLDKMSGDMMKIYLRDLDEMPDLRARINKRTLETGNRVVADRIAQGNSSIDAEAAAAVILGALTHFRLREVLIGPGANGVDRDRFIETWGRIYRAVVAGQV